MEKASKGFSWGSLKTEKISNPCKLERDGL